MAEEYKDPQAKLFEAANRAVAKPEVVEPPAVAAQAPEVIEEVVEEVVEVAEVAIPEVVEDPPIESEPPKVEDTNLEDETTKVDVQEEDNVINDWDTNTGEDVNKPAEFDYTSLATEAGIEAKNKDEFIKAVSEYKAKAEAPDPVAALPENLKKAIEIAGQDGNYLEYLGVTSVNYDAYDSLSLVTSHYSQILVNADGTLDTNMLENKMDSMTDADIEIEGATLRSQYKNAQTAKAADVEATAARNRELADTELKRVLNETTELDGFKLSPTNKKQLYDGITSGNMIAEMFHGADGNIDQAKVLKQYSKYKYGDKQMEYLRQKITHDTKKELLNKLGNVNLKPKPGGLPDITPKTVETGQQKLAAEIREQGSKLFQ